MTVLSIALSADTDIDELLNVTHPEMGSRYRSIIGDLMHIGDYGPHVVELDTGNSSKDGNDPNAAYVVMLFRDANRAAISDNASVHWTDAADIEDAHRRYLNDDMMA